MKTLFTRYTLLDTGETLDVPAYEGPPIDIVELQISASLLVSANETPRFKTQMRTVHITKEFAIKRGLFNEKEEHRLAGFDSSKVNEYLTEILTDLGVQFEE